MFYLQNNLPGHQDALHEPTLTFEAAASAGLDEGSPSTYPMLVGSTTARTRGMLTRVASWIAMTNAVSAAAICARAEVPPSSVSGARSASGKSLPDAVLLQYLCVPFLLNGWELCEATDIDALATVQGVRRSGRAHAQLPGLPVLPADREIREKVRTRSNK